MKFRPTLENSFPSYKKIIISDIMVLIINCFLYSIEPNSWFFWITNVFVAISSVFIFKDLVNSFKKGIYIDDDCIIIYCKNGSKKEIKWEDIKTGALFTSKSFESKKPIREITFVSYDDLFISFPTSSLKTEDEHTLLKEIISKIDIQMIEFK